MSRSKSPSPSERGDNRRSNTYLARSEKTYAPSRLLAFACETQPGDTTGDGPTVPRSFVAVHILYSNFRRGAWMIGKETRFDTRAAFWKYVLRLTRSRSTIYGVTPHGMDDLTLLDVWGQFASGQLRLWSTPERDVYRTNNTASVERKFRGRVLAGNPPDVVHAMGPAGPVKFVGLRNYYPSDLADLAVQFGTARTTPPDPDTRSLTPGWSAADAARVTRDAMHGLTEWWRANESGPWRDTTPSLALSLFKTRFLEHKLLLHDNPDARRLERLAMHGPRQSVWYFGDIGDHPGFRGRHQPPPERSAFPSLPGPVFRVDVRSQYPFLMNKHVFPARFRGTYGETSPDHLTDLLGLWGIIAVVKVRSDRAELPVRTADRTIYPTGLFWTALAGPELAVSLALGEVVKVAAYARYELKPTFRAFARHAWEGRLAARNVGDTSGEKFLKLLANSFAGKLAQKPGRFKADVHHSPRKPWGIVFIRDADNRLTEVERGIAGQREVWDKDAETSPVSPASFAYLTSYSRLQMLALRQLLSPHEVYAQHTDCLWVSESGIERLTSAGTIEPDQLGGLRPSDPVSYQRFLSPSHRYADGKWTAGGIAEGFAVKRHCEFHTSIRMNANRGKDVRRSAKVQDVRIVRNLAGIDAPCQIGPDGWAIPFHRRGDEPDVQPPALPKRSYASGPGG